MTEVSRNTGRVGNIVEIEATDQWAVLQKERERLSDPTRGTKHRDFGIVLDWAEKYSYLK